MDKVTATLTVSGADGYGDGWSVGWGAGWDTGTDAVGSDIGASAVGWGAGAGDAQNFESTSAVSERDNEVHMFVM